IGTKPTFNDVRFISLLGARRIWISRLEMSANDPKRTLRALGCDRASAARCGGRDAQTSVVKKVYFDRAGLCEAFLSWHSNHAPVPFSAIARSELIAAFARLPRIGIKVGAAIHTVRLRAGRSLGARLSGVRQDQDQTHRKAGNKAHAGILP